MLKKMMILCLITIFLCQMNLKYALAEEMELKGVAAILMDVKSGDILYEKNSHQERIPASVTKLMTLLLALEKIEQGELNKNDMVTTSAYASSMGGSQIYLAQGEQMSVEEMLISIAVGSANDASVAIAEHIAGSCDNFVVMMNEKAKTLGMHHTHFKNPNGLPMEEHYSTAYDLALLGRELLLNHPQISDYTSIKSYTIRKDSNPFVLNNTNKLLWWYENTNGLKTGWIGSESGYNVVASSNNDNLQLIAVVLGAPKVYENFHDCIKLFDWAKDKYTHQIFYEANNVVTQTQVQKTDEPILDIVARENIALTIEKAQVKQIQSEIIINELCAPIKKGEKVGEIALYIDGEMLKSFDLIATEDKKKYSYYACFKKVAEIFFNGIK